MSPSPSGLRPRISNPVVEGSNPSGDTRYGPLAQLGEQLPYKQKVIDSSPVWSTMIFISFFLFEKDYRVINSVVFFNKSIYKYIYIVYNINVRKRGVT